MKQQWICLSEETRSFYLTKWMWSTVNLQKFKASILRVKAQELQTRTLLLWDAETAPLCIQKSGAELTLTPKHSGIFRYLDFTCTALWFLCTEGSSLNRCYYHTWWGTAGDIWDACLLILCNWATFSKNYLNQLIKTMFNDIRMKWALEHLSKVIFLVEILLYREKQINPNVIYIL